MADSGQEKTEQPTPRKLQEARRKGQVVKSKDLSAAVVLLAAVAFFYALSQNAVSDLERYLTWYFSNCFAFGLPDKHLPRVMWDSLFEILLIFAPILLVIIVFSIISNVMQSGFLIAPEAISAKLERLNPLEGLKRIFSVKSLVELVKSILKVTIVGVVSYLMATSYIPQLLMVFFKNPAQEMLEIIGVIISVAAAGGGAYLLLR
ncbi:MAG: EscU/YscU/HrcU family type III secretion system export apparatus switch protein, partial [Firmicutes bacterium]|nr:EscU/YscU/HrcU family type III secretion system export apparatus switch protein [Bacillota bacterium]